MKGESCITVIQNSRFITLLLLLAPFLLIQCKPPQNELSEEVFANPSVENRPLAFWDWHNGFVDTTRMVHELEQMKEKGMQGGFYLGCRRTD